MKILFVVVLSLCFLLSPGSNLSSAADDTRKEELRKISREALMVSYTLGRVARSYDVCEKSAEKIKKSFVEKGSYSKFWEGLNYLCISACLQGYMDKHSGENNLPKVLKEIDPIFDKQ